MLRRQQHLKTALFLKTSQFRALRVFQCVPLNRLVVSGIFAKRGRCAFTRDFGDVRSQLQLLFSGE